MRIVEETRNICYRKWLFEAALEETYRPCMLFEPNREVELNRQSQISLLTFMAKPTRFKQTKLPSQTSIDAIKRHTTAFAYWSLRVLKNPKLFADALVGSSLCLTYFVAFAISHRYIV